MKLVIKLFCFYTEHWQTPSAAVAAAAAAATSDGDKVSQRSQNFQLKDLFLAMNQGIWIQTHTYTQQYKCVPHIYWKNVLVSLKKREIFHFQRSIELCQVSYCLWPQPPHTDAYLWCSHKVVVDILNENLDIACDMKGILFWKLFGKSFTNQHQL